MYTQVTMDDFEVSCKGLFRALTIREKYMRLAYQRFPRTASQYLHNIEGETFKPEDQLQPGGTEAHQNGQNVFLNTAIVCLQYLSIPQISHLFLRVGKIHLMSRPCQWTWDMLLAWRRVSSMCTTMLRQLTNISQKTFHALTTTPSSMTWISSLLSLPRAQRESFPRCQLCPFECQSISSSGLIPALLNLKPT